MNIHNDSQFLYIETKRIDLKALSYVDVECNGETITEELYYWAPAKDVFFDQSQLYRDIYHNDRFLASQESENVEYEKITHIDLVLEYNDGHDEHYPLLKGKNLKDKDIKKSLHHIAPIIEKVNDAIINYEDDEESFNADQEVSQDIVNIEKVPVSLNKKTLQINDQTFKVSEIEEIYFEIIGDFYYGDDYGDRYEDEFDDDLFYAGDHVEDYLEGCLKQRKIARKGHKDYDFDIDINIGIEYDDSQKDVCIPLFETFSYSKKMMDQYTKTFEHILDLFNEIISSRD